MEVEIVSASRWIKSVPQLIYNLCNWMSTLTDSKQSTLSA